MDSNFFKEAMNELDRLTAMKKVKEDRLHELEKSGSASLKFSLVKGKKYYYSKNDGSKAYRYVGGESNQTVIRIKETHFLRQLIKDLGSEIELLTELKDKHREISYAAVNSRLPTTYQTSFASGSAPASEYGKKWKEAKLKEKAKYPVKYPERLIMQDIEGTPMRSKSELAIANLLIAYGIPFVYELPHVINGIVIYSDFTILSTIDYKTEIIIEHEGMMDQAFYQNIFLDKVNAYLSADIIPGKDVFFTFDDLHGGFDTSVVQNIIDTRLRRRPA